MNSGNAFRDLLDGVEKVINNCPWTKLQDVESYGHTVLDEAREVTEALENRDYGSLKDELGDLLWNAVMVMKFAERRDLFCVEDVIASILEKMKRRKPFIYEDREVTIEEAKRIWREAKAEENPQN